MSKLRLNVRAIALLLAVVLAAVATVALTNYIQGVEARAEASLEPVEAFVAAGPIPQGTQAEAAIQQDLIERAEIPERAALPGGITSLQELEGRVAAVDLVEGEQILAARFVEAQAARGLREIPEDMQAISVQVGIPPGVAGFIQAGDRISMIVQLDAEGESRVQFLLQGLEVLAVGQRTVNEEGESGTTGTTEQVLLTLAVTPEDAEKVAYATLQGTMYFTLLPEDQEAPVDTPGRTAENIFAD